MKIIILLVFLFLPLIVQAQCKNKIDPSKVVLFIDTNNSEPEITVAKKAACERGETLVIAPQNYKEYTKYINEIQNLEWAKKKCTQNCEVIFQKLSEGHKKFSAFKRSQKNIEEATQDALTEINQKNGKIQALLISGHDGGGHFSGSKGGISRSAFSNLMKNNSEINEIKTLMLLGCYTGVQKEISEWISIFPEAKLIAGYDLKAPLSHVPMGHEYISEILTEEKKILTQANEVELNHFAKKNIQSLFGLNTAMYLRCGPEEDEFYFSSKDRSKKFSELDIKNCEIKAAEIKDMYTKVKLYQSGELEPPLDTNGALRQLYDTARSSEHCTEILPRGFNANNVFNLLFYDGVKKSFAKFYKEDLELAQKIINDLNIEEIEKNINQEIKILEENLRIEEESIKLLESDPEKYRVLKQKAIDNSKKLLEDLIEANPFLKEFSTNQYPTRSLSENETVIFYKYQSMKYQFDNETLQLSSALSQPKGVTKYRLGALNRYKASIKRLNGVLADIKESPNKLKEIWSPTSENLQSRSRKELLRNIHNINYLLSIQGLNPEQTKALGWINHVASNHLQYFQNPFSWHEVSSEDVETPQTPIRLKDFSPYPYRGIGGGGYGMGMGGGVVGGMLGGGGGI